MAENLIMPANPISAGECQRASPHCKLPTPRCDAVIVLLLPAVAILLPAIFVGLRAAGWGLHTLPGAGGWGLRVAGWGLRAGEALGDSSHQLAGGATDLEGVHVPWPLPLLPQRARFVCCDVESTWGLKFTFWAFGRGRGRSTNPCAHAPAPSGSIHPSYCGRPRLSGFCSGRA